MHSQFKDTSSKKQDSSSNRPPFAASQRDEILRLLREAGPRGVSRADLIFNHRFTQCGARIDELKHANYVIRSEDRGGRYPTWYVLQNEPLSEQANENGGDWHEHETGKSRPSADDLPLFTGARK